MDRSRTIRDWSGLEELRGELVRYVSRRCRDTNEVEDVVQETLLRAARYRRGLTDGERLRAWVRRIAANVHRDRVRREGLLPRAGEEALAVVRGREDYPGEARDEGVVSIAGVVMERSEAFATLGSVMRQLSAHERAVLGAYYAGSPSCQRAGRECGIPVSLVKVRLFRARRKLLAALRRRIARDRHAHLVAERGRKAALEQDLVPDDLLAPLEALRALVASTPRRLAPSARAGAGRAGRIGRAVAVLLALSGPLLAGSSVGTLPPTRQAERGVLGPPTRSLVLPGRPEVPPSARERLAAARAARFGLRGLRGEELAAGRRRAVAACRAVREHHPGTAEACEAAFRGAELLRAAGDVDGAREELEQVGRQGVRSPFVARAELELGHLERRLGRLDAALARYERVVADVDARALWRDRAALWIGRTYVLEQRDADAVRVWTRVAEHGSDPFVRVHAFDGIALSLVRRGDLEGAAGVLERCRRSLSGVAREATSLGERVREALASMRALTEVRRAIDARTAVDDAAAKKHSESRFTLDARIR